MLEVLADRTYRRLFAAQVIALAGTGLLTVALSLLAYDLAGERAGAVLGTALAVKMIAYVGIAPIAGALAVRLPRRPLLIGLDLVRAAVALLLPFVTEVWQIYVLIFALQSASAAFTPTFQATIPEVLPDEARYTRALSLSRLAYDLENLLSPTLAALLLTVVSYHSLFVGTVAGFLASAALVFATRLPRPDLAQAGEVPPAPFLRRLTSGARIYLATPRLRGLLALNLAVASAGAMVIVNTVVIVRGPLGLGEPALALAMGCFGAGSMAAALLLPRLLDRTGDRQVMLPAALGLGGLTVLLSAVLGAGLAGDEPSTWLWPTLLCGWALLGLAYSAVQTPSGRLLRRSAHAPDRPALFAAQFALSHACWLATYPLAGWLGSAAGLPATMALLGALALLAALVAARLWPTEDPEVIPHAHPELPPDHPHLRSADGSNRHAHPFVIDDLHHGWPVAGRA